MSPDITNGTLGGKITPVENHCFRGLWKFASFHSAIKGALRSMRPWEQNQIKKTQNLSLGTKNDHLKSEKSGYISRDFQNTLIFLLIMEVKTKCLVDFSPVLMFHMLCGCKGWTFTPESWSPSLSIHPTDVDWTPPEDLGGSLLGGEVQASQSYLLIMQSLSLPRNILWLPSA